MSAYAMSLYRSTNTITFPIVGGENDYQGGLG